MVEEREKLVWTVHPIRSGGWRTAFLIAVWAATCLAVWTATKSVLYVVFAVVVIGAATRKFVLPTTYKMDKEGIEARSLFGANRRPWTRYRSFYADRNGVLLSPFSRANRLVSHRGLYVLFGDRRDEVIAFVSRRMSSAPEPIAGTGRKD